MLIKKGLNIHGLVPASLVKRACGLAAIVGAVVLLSACVSPPFVTEGVSTELRPIDVATEDVATEDLADNDPVDEDVAEKTANAAKPEKVLWGGVVINAANTASASEIEILSYPLDYLQRPDVSQRSTGRFLLVVDDFVEPADFAAGRRVTALGSVQGTETGRIGESEYSYPVLKLDAPADLHRWSAQDYYNSRPYSPIGIGIGISISN